MIFEATHVTKSGKEFPVEINSSVIELDGRLMILAVVRDISTRKQAEEQLRETNERLHILFDQAADAIYVSDSEGCFNPGKQAGL